MLPLAHARGLYHLIAPRAALSLLDMVPDTIPATFVETLAGIAFAIGG